MLYNGYLLIFDCYPQFTWAFIVMERVKQLAAHLSGSLASGLRAIEVKKPDDVVITLAIRSPLCKAKKGGFKDARWVTTLELILESESHVDHLP